MSAARNHADKARFHFAIASYFAALGDRAAQPPGYVPGCASRNGTVFLRNCNGTLAIVTSRGKVFDRIGGNRLDVEVAA